MNCRLRIRAQCVDTAFRAIFLVGLCFLTNCRPKESGQAPEKLISASEQPTGDQRPERDVDPDEEHARAMKAALHAANEARKARLQNPPAEAILLPNPETGPGMPIPARRNYFEVDASHQGYLLCSYQVDEIDYSKEKEDQAFFESMTGIRNLGANRFPPVKWVAIVILNRADSDGKPPLEKYVKAGGIFDISQIFDTSNDLRQIVTHCPIDREPLKHVPKSKSGWTWLMVERHTKSLR